MLNGERSEDFEKIPKGQSEAANPSKTDNTMATRTNKNLHRKLKMKLNHQINTLRIHVEIIPQRTDARWGIFDLYNDSVIDAQ